MNILPGLYDITAALGIAVHTVILGYCVLVKLAVDQEFLYINLRPFFSALAQSRFIRLLKQLLYPLKVSACIVFQVLQYIIFIFILLMKESRISSLFYMEHWMGDRRFWVLIIHSLLPSSCQFPANALISLMHHTICGALRSRRNAVLRNLLDRYKDVHLSERVCAIRLLGLDRKAEVYMVSTTLGVLDLLNDVAREPSGESVPPIEEESRNIEEPAESKSIQAAERILDEPHRHWMIEIPDRRMAWHLIRNPATGKVTIEHKEFVQELTTAFMGVKLTKIKRRPLGSTYVSNLFIKKVREIEGKLSILQKKKRSRPVH